MERFVAHARMHGELLDLPLAIEAYLASRRAEVPTPDDWYMTQAQQALSFFSRGTERWMWIKALRGGMMTRRGGKSSRHGESTLTGESPGRGELARWGNWPDGGDRPGEGNRVQARSYGFK